MTILWIIAAVLGGCLVGVLGMCLLIVSHRGDDQTIHMLKDS